MKSLFGNGRVFLRTRPASPCGIRNPTVTPGGWEDSSGVRLVEFSASRNCFRIDLLNVKAPGRNHYSTDPYFHWALTPGRALAIYLPEEKFIFLPGPRFPFETNRVQLSRFGFKTEEPSGKRGRRRPTFSGHRVLCYLLMACRHSEP